MPQDTEHFIYHPLTDEQVAQYEREGYLMVGRTLTDSGLEAMRQQCMDAWKLEKEDFDPDKTWLQNALLPNIHHKAPLVRSYYFDGPLVDIAERVVSPNLKAVTSQLTFKMRGNTKPFGWHQDNGYGELEPYTAISCLTALDDTDQENGCLWLIPGSHKRGQIELKRDDKQSEIVMDLDESEAVPVPMKAGEALFFHCWMLHKSDGNLSKDRDRRLLFCRYADADAVEVYNNRQPRLGRLLRGRTRFAAVRAFEMELT